LEASDEDPEELAREELSVSSVMGRQKAADDESIVGMVLVEAAVMVVGAKDKVSRESWDVYE
jgi:hypothetical protein